MGRVRGTALRQKATDDLEKTDTVRQHRYTLLIFQINTKDNKACPMEKYQGLNTYLRINKVRVGLGLVF